MLWWQVSVIPAAWETKTGEFHEPGRQRLQCVEVVPLHSSLGDREGLHLGWGAGQGQGMTE